MQIRKVKHKFHAQPCEKDNIKFPSKLEGRYYQQLKLREKAGEVLFFLRQVPFDLPGGIQYRIDFIVFLADGTVECIDCKGVDTPVSKMKIKQVEDLYPVDIKIVRSV